MTKWLWIAAAVVALVVLIVSQRGGTKRAYVNGLPEYTALPGREYIFQKDCYVFKLRRQDANFPFVGANAPDLAASVPELPKEVSDSQVGFKNREVRILETIRTGSRFKIISVRRDQTRDQTTISFEILMIDDVERKYPRLDAYFILDHAPERNGQAPNVLPEYAVERVKK